MIKCVELELKYSNEPIAIFLSGTLTVYTDKDGVVRVEDGHHNNGGWCVKGSYQDVVRKIKMA